MTEQQFYGAAIWFGFVSAGVVFVSLLFFTAPYGRHVRSGWGPTLPNRAGWILMETAAVFSILFFFFTAQDGPIRWVWIFLLVWETHYIYRTYIFPFTLHDNGKRMPVTIAVSAIAFNVFNGYLNGRHLAWNADFYTQEWFTDVRFIVGTILFFGGLALNVYSDRILIALRGDGSTGYKIPKGGLYRWVTCPNYLGEIIEWTGWAILTWSTAGLVFAVWTAANLVPRAIANLRWYEQEFPEYARERKAVIPFVL